VKKPKKPKFVHALLHDHAGRVVAQFPFPRLQDAERMAKRDVPGGYVNLRKIPRDECVLS
jgi:hypothetical protein